MAVQWGLQGQGFDALQTLRVAGQAQQQAMQEREQAAAFAAQQRKLALGQQVGQMAASGDYTGARNTALNAGDFDFAKHVSGIEDDHRQELQNRAETVGAIAVGLKNVPFEQRAARLQTLAPQLAARGFTPDQLSQVDLSDGGLDSYISFATSASDAVKAYAKSQEPYTLNDGDQRFVGGQMIAENAKDAPKPHYIFDSQSGSWLLEPGTGGGAPGSLPQAGYAPQPARNTPMTGSAGRTQFGWTPRARNGGDNSDAAVDGKIGGMSSALGLSPTDTFPPNMTDMQIARALTLSEGGRGSLADRNNNPGNLTDPRTGGYRKFATKEEGLAAAAAQVRRNRARGQNSIQLMVEGVPVGGQRQAAPAQGNAAVVNVRPPKSESGNAPSGYRYNGDRLEPIPGGPADPNTSTQRNVQSNRTAEANYRKEFDQLPEVKTFKTARQQFNTLRDLGTKKNPTAQDDIALIFTYMKTLDPSSVVREGEFAQAQNAAGVDASVRNMYNRALKGTRLNPEQRQNMVRTGYANYKNYRDAYNQQAENYRGYARDNGINPDRVARTYTPDAPSKARQVGRFKIERVN